MKILRLRFKNLNSLAGVWEIDFTHPDYVSSGIFAITGPTGAGKSTILDAICLALYGQTPRLGRITQSENEIMSRQSGECFAEVTFETAKGSFCCHWSQHRSRRQADGQLQSPRHEIAEAASGQILESKLKSVAGKVEEVTGMDFDRFTRSMLLAQGGFAAFLQARADERAPILEQITGTAIYSRVSIKVHERTTEERKRLEELRAGLDGIQLLAPAEAAALHDKKGGLLREESTLIATAGSIRAAQAWQERIAALEAELRQLDQDRQLFAVRKAAALPELEQLEAATRAQKLDAGHARIILLRGQQEREQGGLTAATEGLPQARQAWQNAFEALDQAEAGLSTARDGQAQEAELIQATRALDVRLGEARAQLQALADDREKTGQQNNTYRLAIARCDRRTGSTAEELRGVAAFLDQHRADAALSGALTGIEHRLKALKALTLQDRTARTRLARHAALVENATLAAGRTESTWQEARQAVMEAGKRFTELRAARDSLLQGRDLPEWRAAAEQLAARQQRLGIMQESVARMEEAAQKLAVLKQRLDELEQKQQELVRQEESLAREGELREQVTRQLQDNVLLLNRVRSLEEDRKQLVDGVPCPLCGASEHPYATGNIPRLDEARQRLEQARAEAARVHEQLSRSRQELVAAAKDRQQAGQEQSVLGEQRQRDEEFCRAAAVELGLAAGTGVMLDAGAWLHVIRHESAICREELARQRAVILEVEAKEREEGNAQAVLNKLKDELAGHDQARLAAGLGRETALAEGKRLEAESAASRADLERALAEAGQALAAYGRPEIVPDEADELLTALTARRDTYVRQMQSGERLEKALADLAAEREKQRALLAESEKGLNDKEEQYRDKSAQRAALVEQRLELYGERDPAQEEKRLAAALSQAGERREAAAQEEQRLRLAFDLLQQQLEGMTQSLAQRHGQLAVLEEEFGRQLAVSGFADEAAYVRACLPRERHDELARLADGLHREETALHTRQRDRAEALAAELDKKLTLKPLDEIREEHATISAQLGELQKELGALEQQVRQHAEQHALHRTRLQEIEVQRQECQRWELLHSLIGSGDGKRFRNFAQGLTFELMIAHANRQLQKMSDRYILLRDEREPLELNVIDNYQAGEIRSTKNLSGGESFIASLALSLGLSSMASRNVRVDSLFLDEGFGTLDEDALETALETLSGLQREGKLIGIISHVPALKERIGTRIQVESGSAGRSTLGGPGCRRIV